MALVPPRSAWLRLVVLGVVIAAIAVIVAGTGPPSGEQVRAEVRDAGVLGLGVFVLLYVGLALAPVPKNVASVAAGAVFGLATGFGVVLVSAVLGASIAFWIARLLGRDAVERYTGARAARVDAVIVRHGVLGIVLLRLVPLVPYTALNYLAGLSALRWWHYLVGSSVGMVPGTAALVGIGAYGTDPGSLPFISAAVGLVLLAGLGIVVARVRAGPAGDPPEPSSA